MRCRDLLNWATPAALLVASAALAAPVVDGQLDADYTTVSATPLSVQGASVIEVFSGTTLELCAQGNNANILGVATPANSPIKPYDPPDTDPALVTTGIEFAIDVVEIGGPGTNIRVTAVIADGDRGFFSNQISGGLPADSDPLGDSTILDLATITGNQFLTIPVNNGAGAATVDGTLDLSYGSSLFINTQATTEGNNTDPDPITSNGAEINGIYGYVDTGVLYLFVAGNLNTSAFNKIYLFIDSDSGATGQNPITETGGVDFGVLGDMTGLAFDAGFVPNYFVGYVNGASTEHYLNAQALPDVPNGSGSFIGGGDRTGGAPDPITGLGPNGAGDVTATTNNSNVGGVAGVQFQATGVWDSDPNTVDEGFEFRVELAGIGYVGGTDIKIGGAVAGQDFGFWSNQVIGGLPTGSGNLEGAQSIDFTSIAGDQFATYTVPGTLTQAAIPLDGDITGERSEYTLVWANDDPAGVGIGTEFGNNTDPDPILSEGSEIDAVYMRAGLDPDNGDTPTLWVMVAGNLETNFNKLLLFLDTDTTPGVGQNFIRNDNAFFEFGNLNNNVGGTAAGVDALTWDAGFEPDFHFGYGGDADSRVSFGCQLLVDGGGFGGQFGFGPQVDPTDVSFDPLVDPLCGDLIERSGFGDNTDATRDEANGSELDGFFAYRDSSNLYLFFAGNFETDFRKLDIFLDINDGLGQNTLIYADETLNAPEIEDPPSSGNFIPNPAWTGNPAIDNPGGATDAGALNRMGGPITIPGDPDPIIQDGFTFDTGFLADHYIYLTNGGVGTVEVGEAQVFGGIARLRGATDPADAGSSRYWGETNFFEGGFFSGGDEGVFEDAMALVDNSNIGGVEGAPNEFGDVTDAPNVTTGFEVVIPLSQFGVPDGQGGSQAWDGTGDFKIVAFLNTATHDFVSNQFLPHICALDQGEPRNVDLNDRQGLQFAELTPNGTNNFDNLTAVPDECLIRGACCVGEVCSVETEDDCLNVLGGTYLGDFTDCTGDPCLLPRGACCVSGVCLDNLTEADCLATPGVYQGDGSTCTVSGACGACCVFACDGGSPVDCLTVLSVSECDILGGNYQGDFTDCSGASCVAGVDFCIGDLNGDGATLLGDFGIFSANFGATVPVGTLGDLNCDGEVLLGDFGIFSANFGCDSNP